MHKKVPAVTWRSPRSDTALCTKKEKPMYNYQHLRDLREDTDKSQSEIAVLLKTTVQQYSRYERGDRELPMHHFITLARYYNVSLDYLAGLIDKPRRLH